MYRNWTIVSIIYWMRNEPDFASVFSSCSKGADSSAHRKEWPIEKAIWNYGWKIVRGFPTKVFDDLHREIAAENDIFIRMARIFCFNLPIHWWILSPILIYSWWRKITCTVTRSEIEVMLEDLTETFYLVKKNFSRSSRSALAGWQVNMRSM